MNTTWKLFIGALALFATSATFGSSYRLDFAGSTATGSYSGSIILDYSSVDQNPSVFVAQYNDIVTAATMIVNGVEYTLSNTFVNTGFAFDNADGVGDFLGFGFSVSNTATGDEDYFAIQFQQEDGSAFSTAELPTNFSLTDYQGFDLNNTNSTGVVLPIAGLGGTDVFFGLDSASLMPVPLPAGIVLLFSALATLTGVRKRAS